MLKSLRNFLKPRRDLKGLSQNYAQNAKEKDIVETHLCRAVCAGELSLEDAQEMILTDWYKVYLEIKSEEDEK